MPVLYEMAYPLIAPIKQNPFQAQIDLAALLGETFTQADEKERRAAPERYRPDGEELPTDLSPYWRC